MSIRRRAVYVSFSFAIYICLYGCSSSPEQIERTFEEAIGVDFPPNFKIIENKILVTWELSKDYSIEYGVGEFSKLMKQIDLVTWELVGEDLYEYWPAAHEGAVIQLFVDDRRLEYNYLK